MLQCKYLYNCLNLWRKQIEWDCPFPSLPKRGIGVETSLLRGIFLVLKRGVEAYLCTLTFETLMRVFFQFLHDFRIVYKLTWFFYISIKWHFFGDALSEKSICIKFFNHSTHSYLSIGTTYIVVQNDVCIQFSLSEFQIFMCPHLLYMEEKDPQ